MMNLRAVDEWQFRFELADVQRQVGAGDEHRVGAVITHEGAGDDLKLVELCRRTAALDEIEVERVDTCDALGGRHDDVEIGKSTEHARCDGEARADEREALRFALPQHVRDFRDHVDERQRRHGGKLFRADVRRDGDDRRQFGARACELADESVEIAGEAVDIVCAHIGADRGDVRVRDGQMRRAPGALVKRDELPIIVNGGVEPQPADEAEMPPGAHVSGTLPT